jgi:hypothetical protein
VPDTSVALFQRRDRRPIFVDPSGRRARAVRSVAAVIAVLIVGYLMLVVASLVEVAPVPRLRPPGIGLPRVGAASAVAIPGTDVASARSAAAQVGPSVRTSSGDHLSISPSAASRTVGSADTAPPLAGPPAVMPPASITTGSPAGSGPQPGPPRSSGGTASGHGALTTPPGSSAPGSAGTGVKAHGNPGVSARGHLHP